MVEENIFEDEAMDSDETKKNVNKLKEEVNKLNSEIEEIQDKCRHTEYSIKNTSKDATATIRRVCDDCNAEIGYPTNDELKENGYM
jgi:peptidoglycan hydrolase CwlO-like protein